MSLLHMAERYTLLPSPFGRFHDRKMTTFSHHNLGIIASKELQIVRKECIKPSQVCRLQGKIVVQQFSLCTYEHIDTYVHMNMETHILRVTRAHVCYIHTYLHVHIHIPYTYVYTYMEYIKMCMYILTCII